MSEIIFETSEKPAITFPIVQGVKGETGISAYQLAVNNGYVGDEASWLLSLKGPQGVQGSPGSGVKITQWVAGTYASGDQVNHLGKDWVSNASIVAGDIPGTSPKWVDRLNAYVSKKYLENKIARAIATTDIFSDVVGFANNSTGITGVVGSSNTMKIPLNKINTDNPFRIDFVITTNAVNSDSKIRLMAKNSALDSNGDLFLEITDTYTIGQFSEVNELTSSGLVPGMKLQFSIIGQNGIITASISDFKEWDGNLGSGYMPTIGKKIFYLTKLNTINYLGQFPLKDLDLIEITATNGNEFVLNSINVLSESLELPNFPLNTIYSPKVYNDSQDGNYRPLVFAKQGSRALAQWHHPNGSDANTFINPGMFSGLYNSGIAICFITANSFNNPNGTPLYGAGVTASNWGAPAGMKYRKKLMDDISAILKVKNIVSIGASMGGLNALAYSSLYSDNITAIVSISGALDLVDNFNSGSFNSIIKKAYGSAYVCKANNTGVAVSDASKWTKISNEKSAPPQKYYENNLFYDTYSSGKAYVVGDVVFVDYTGIATGLESFSPYFNGNKLSQIPTLLIHGDSDTLIPMAQSANYKTYIDGKGGVKTELITVVGGTHISADCFKTTEILDFINRYI